MPTKNIYLFDDSNLPLKISGIQMELIDSVSGLLIDKKLSANRNPTLGMSSLDWGADLIFTASSNPLDLYITDTTYEYPGNTIQFLNGQTTDRIDIDLMKIPTSPMTSPPSYNSTPAEIISAIQKEEEWSVNEKRAVINLLTNYIDIVYKSAVISPELTKDLQRIITNWDEALHKLGVDKIELGLQVFAQDVW